MMNRKEILDRAKDLVSDGTLRAALNLLRDNFSDSDYGTMIIILSARINRLREQELQGIISHENASIENVQVMCSILSIISDMANDSEILLDTPELVEGSSQQPTIQIVDGRNTVTRDINVEGDMNFEDSGSAISRPMIREIISFIGGDRSRYENISVFLSGLSTDAVNWVRLLFIKNLSQEEALKDLKENPQARIDAEQLLEAELESNPKADAFISEIFGQILKSEEDIFRDDLEEISVDLSILDELDIKSLVSQSKEMVAKNKTKEALEMLREGLENTAYNNSLILLQGKMTKLSNFEKDIDSEGEFVYDKALEDYRDAINESLLALLDKMKREYIDKNEDVVVKPSILVDPVEDVVPKPVPLTGAVTQPLGESKK